MNSHRNLSNEKEDFNNIVLIGMPASGKSTAGVILAKILGMDFTDTDIIIQQQEGVRLEQIIEQRGVEGFLKTEESALLNIKADNTVIATGGSAVYSKAGMKHLAIDSIIIYLKVEMEELKKRLKNVKERGVVLRPGESIDEMFAVRSKLYEEYSDITISEDEFSIEDTVRSIIDAIREKRHPKV
ncbi:MAG: shikimate kinase [Lachnospiraceae bacterium]|nr:shikimate kinase [Lachnospiraceae bacterium]